MAASVVNLQPRELTPEGEARRLAAVQRYEILDTPPDGSFDRITAIAARLFCVPISIISLVDHDRIWFKSHHGLNVPQIDRGPGLCASAILQDAPWILNDAKNDPRSLANPLVAGDFGLRFYVGVPLRTNDGFNLGTLCVIDRAARDRRSVASVGREGSCAATDRIDGEGNRPPRDEQSPIGLRLAECARSRNWKIGSGRAADPRLQPSFGNRPRAPEYLSECERRQSKWQSLLGTLV